MKQSRLALIPLLFLCSCATIQPGNDPVLVRAEAATSVAFDTFDAFFALERSQEVWVKANAPEVHKFANSMRNSPGKEGLASKFLKTARAAEEAYRLNRTAENKVNLQTAVALLQTALSQVAVYTAQLNKGTP